MLVRFREAEVEEEEEEEEDEREPVMEMRGEERGMSISRVNEDILTYPEEMVMKCFDVNGDVTIYTTVASVTGEMSSKYEPTATVFISFE